MMVSISLFLQAHGIEGSMSLCFHWSIGQWVTFLWISCIGVGYVVAALSLCSQESSLSSSVP